MKRVKLNEISNELVEQLPKGAFLTVKSEGKVNTMTIGWGFCGIMWRKPTMIVAVRYSRYTNELIQKADDFTVSLPLTDNLKEALKYCGSKSGRDVDKIKECGLTLYPSLEVESPVIKECDLFLECKKVYSQPMDPNLIIEDNINKLYPTQDYHEIYYGDIKGIYRR